MELGLLFQKLRMFKNNNDQVLQEMEKLQRQLQQEQNRALSMQNELKQTSSSQIALQEVKKVKKICFIECPSGLADVDLRNNEIVN